MANVPESTITPPSPVTSTEDVGSATKQQEFPDCIIASSNRFDDLRPFCDRCYTTNSKKWGEILPWEFPQNASKEAEEHFIRQWFDDLTIHMYGGVHGDGAGFRFLKQAWYSIALYNWEYRVPAIANMWMSENVDLMEDPNMFEYLCALEVEVKTFFKLEDMETYGEKLLGFAVRKIQVAIKQSQQAAVVKQIVHVNSPAVARASPSIFDPGEMKSEPSMSLKLQPSPVGFFAKPKAMDPSSAPVDQSVSKEQTVPFPTYKEPGSGLHASSRDFTPSYDAHQYDQHYTRKRGMSSGKRFAGRGGYNNYGRQQHGQHENGRPQPGYGVTDDYSYVASPTHQLHQGLPSHAPSRNMDPAAGQFVPPGMQGADTYANMQYAGFSRDSVHMGHRGGSGQYSARNFSNESAAVGFDDLTNRRGGYRRDSQGSRGGGVWRGSTRGGRVRGGRDSGSFSDHYGTFDDRFPRNDFGNKSGKRRPSGAREIPWQRGNERPQYEDQFPERYFSESGRSMPGNSSSGPVMSQLFSPQYDNGGSLVPPMDAGQRVFSVPYPPANRQGLRDDLVQKDYVGADATEIRSLIVFNIPSQVSDMDIALAITTAFGPPVKHVQKIAGEMTNGNFYPSVAVIVEFDSHHQVRQVLNNKGAELFGKPARAEVLRQWWDPTHQKYAAFHTPDGRRIPNLGVNGYLHPAEPQTWQEYRPERVPHRKLFDPNAPTMNQGHRDQAAGASNAASSALTYSLKVPLGNKHESSLSTVPSANTTPTGSEVNTPKKSNNRKKFNKKEPANVEKAAASNNSRPSEAHHEPATATVTKDSEADTSIGGKRAPSASVASTIKKRNPEFKAHVDTLFQHAMAFDSKRPSETPKPPSDVPSKHDTCAAPEEPVAISNAKVAPDQPSKRTEHKSESDTVDESFHTAKASPSNFTPVNEENAKELVSPGHVVSAKAASPQEPTEGISPKTTNAPVAKRLSPVKPAEEETTGANEEPVKATSADDQKPAAVKKGKPSKRKGKKDVGHVDKPANAGTSVPTEDANDKSKVTSEKENQVPSLTTPRVVSDGSASRTSAFHTAPSTPALPQDLHHPDAAGKGKASSVSGTKSTETATSVAQEVPEVPVEVPDGPDGQDEVLTATKEPNVDVANAVMENDNRVKVADKSSEETQVSNDVLPKTDKGSTKANTDAEESKQPTATVQSKPKEKQKEKQKGPEQTESLSVFGGKKTKKSNKSTKGGTVKGRKQVQNSSGGSVNSDSTRMASGSATPVNNIDNLKTGATSSANDKKSSKGEKLTSNSEENTDLTIDTTSSTGQATSRSSLSSSPTKGLFNNFIGLIMGTSKPTSVASSPDVLSRKDTVENELTESKEPASSSDALVTHARSAGAVGNELTTGRVTRSKGPVVGSDAASRDDSEEAFNTAPAGLGISVSDETAPESDTSSQHTAKKGKNRKGKRKESSSSQDATSNGSPDTIDSAHAIPTLSLSNSNSNSNEQVSDDRSMTSSNSIGRPSPPVSPESESKLTPSKRKKLDMRGEPDHIVKAPPPLNQNVKRTHSSKTPSESTSQSSGEGTETTALERYRAKEKKKRQNKALIDLITSNNQETALARDADGEDESGGPTVYYLIRNHQSDDAVEQQTHQLVGNVLHFLDDSDSGNRLVEVEGDDGAEPEVAGLGKQSSVSETESDKTAPAE